MRTFSDDIVAAIEAGERQEFALGNLSVTYLGQTQLTGGKITENIGEAAHPLNAGAFPAPRLSMSAVPGNFPTVWQSVVDHSGPGSSWTYPLRGAYNAGRFLYGRSFCLSVENEQTKAAVFDGENYAARQIKNRAGVRFSLDDFPSLHFKDLVRKAIGGSASMDDLPTAYDSYSYMTQSNVPACLYDGSLSRYDLIRYGAAMWGYHALIVPDYVNNRPTETIKFFQYNTTQTPFVISRDRIITLSCGKKDRIVKGVKVRDTDGNERVRGVDEGDANYEQIQITDNPLITPVARDSVAYIVQQIMNGFTYTPYRLTMPQDPRIELGDKIQFTDYEGNTRTSYVAEITRQFNGAMTLAMGM